jgi:adenylate kinase family enzyme
MKRVAVFGNTGAGKSTLARRLSEITGLPLYPIDLMQFRAGGDKVPDDEFLAAHAALLRRPEWIIDGYGTATTVWQHLAAADTLVYIDLPLPTHYWWVTKRLVKGVFKNPEGWPDNSPLWSSTMHAYKVAWLCHRHLTPKYRRFVAEAVTSKRVHHLRSRREIAAFLDAVRREHDRRMG